MWSPQGSVESQTPSTDARPESVKSLRTTSSSTRSKDTDAESVGLGPISQLRGKGKGETSLDTKSLVTAVAAAATAATATSTSTAVETRRVLKKGQFLNHERMLIGFNHSDFVFTCSCLRITVMPY